jgi:hypothetical protein
VGGLEQLLGGDAPDVEAGPADPALLDEGDVEPGAGAVERGGVAAGAAADDDDVVVLGRGTTSRGCDVGRSAFATLPAHTYPLVGWLSAFCTIWIENATRMAMARTTGPRR